MSAAVPSPTVRLFVAAALGCEDDTVVAGSGFGTHPMWDSLGHLRLLEAIERDFGIPLDTESAERFVTVDALSALFADGVHALDGDGAAPSPTGERP
ncbi:MAG: acyl carrier protein [Actinomycetota bacterium]